MKLTTLAQSLILLFLVVSCQPSTITTEDPSAVSPSPSNPNTEIAPANKDTSVDVKSKIFPALVDKTYSSCERIKDFYMGHKATVYKDADDFFVDYEISAHKGSECKDYAVEEIYTYSSYKIEKASIANPRTLTYNLNLKVINIWDYNDEVSGRAYNDFWAGNDEFHKSYRKTDELFFTQLQITEDNNYVSIPFTFKYSGDSRDERMKDDFVQMGLPGVGGKEVMDEIGKLIVDNEYNSCSLVNINGQDYYARQVFGFKSYNEENPFYVYNNVTIYNDVDCSDQIPDQFYTTYGLIKSIKTIADQDGLYDIDIEVLEVHDHNGLTNDKTEIAELIAGLQTRAGSKYNGAEDRIYARIELTLNSDDPSLPATAISIPLGIGIDSNSSPSDRITQGMMDVYLGGQEPKQAQAVAKAEAAKAEAR